MNIEIMDATAEDVEGIQTVLNETWLATYPNQEVGITREDVLAMLENSFDPERLQQRREYFKNPLENKKSVVAKDGGKVVGTSSFTKEVDFNKLSTIYVLPEYQGKGIGKMLWDSVKLFADPSKPIIVQVATYNENAISFYKKLGFLDTGKRFSDERFRMKSGAIIPEMELVMNP